MKTLTTLMELHRSQLEDEKPWIWLYKVPVPSDPLTAFRLTNYTEPVPFDEDASGTDQTFDPFPIFHGGLEESSSGDLPTIEIRVGNVTREIGDFVEAYDGLIGQEVYVWLVNAAQITDRAASIETRAKVRSAKVTNELCVFTLSEFNLYQKQLPPHRVLADFCGHEWGGPRCGYAIPASPGGTVGTGFATCPRLLSSCQERGDDEVARGLPRLHPLRFGAFKGIPSNSSA